jgi:hypothetical protein
LVNRKQCSYIWTLNDRAAIIVLNESWNKPEKAKEWRAELPQTEAVEK